MKYKYVVSFLSVLTIGLFLVSGFVETNNGILPYIIGVSVLSGISVYFLFGYFDSLFSAQRESNLQLNRNSERLIKELGSMKETLSHLSSQHQSSINQIATTMITSLKDVDAHMLKAMEEQTSMIKIAEDAISTAVNESMENMTAQLSAQNKESQNVMTTILNVQEKSRETMTGALSSLPDLIKDVVCDKTKLLQGLLTQIYDIQSATNKSVTVLKKSIINGFDNIIGVNAQYEQSLDVINKSIAQYFRDNDSLQKEINVTIDEIKTLQVNLKESVKVQDEVIKRVLDSVVGRLNEASITTLNSLENNHLELKKSIESMILNMKSDSELVVTKMLDSMADHRKLSEDEFLVILNELKRLYRDSNIRIEDSNKRLNDSLKELFENQGDELSDIAEELKHIGSKIDDGNTEINIAILDMTKEMTKLSSIVPQIKELSKSEEQLMKELERICSARR